MKRNAKLLAAGAVGAAVAGYVAGILTAPKSGRETREDIKRGAKHVQQQTEKELKRLHTDLAATIESAKEKLKPATGKTRDQLQLAIDTARLSKDKAQQVLNAFNEGDAADQDLASAVKEARDALKHLRSFIIK